MSFSTKYISVFKKIITNLKSLFTKIKIKIEYPYISIKAISVNNDLYTNIILDKHFIKMFKNNLPITIEMDAFDLYNIIKKITFRYNYLQFECTKANFKISACCNSLITNNLILYKKIDIANNYKDEHLDCPFNKSEIIVKSDLFGNEIEKIIHIFECIYFKNKDNKLLVIAYNDMIEVNISIPSLSNNEIIFSNNKYNLNSIYSIIKLSYILPDNIIYITANKLGSLQIKYNLPHNSKAEFVIPTIYN